MRLVNKDGAAAPGGTDEAKKCAKEVAGPHPAHRAQAYNKQTQVSNATTALGHRRQPSSGYTAGAQEEPHRTYSVHPVHEINQTEVLGSMKVVGSPIANAHRAGEGRAADAYPDCSTNGALTP